MARIAGIQRLHPDEALRSLRTDRGGLSNAEAERRRAEFGPNVLERVRREPVWLRLVKSFTHFFALILWLAAALAFVAEWRQPGQGMATLGFAIVGVIVVNGLFAFWQDYRAERALAALMRLMPHRTKLMRDGHAVLLPTADVVPGDVILLAEGDNVPADCRLIEAFGVRVNNATVTGESVPQARRAKSAMTEDLAASHNILLAGTSLVSGEGTAVAFATGSRTEFGKIARLAQGTAEAQSPLVREIAFVSRVVAALASFIGALFFLIGLWLQLPFWQNFIFAIGIIVANVPEGLLPTVTLALAMAAERMAKRNVVIRHLPAVEALGSATVICTDKTGTLTQNRMAVKEVFVTGGFHAPDRLAGPESGALRRLVEIAAHCHTLRAAAEAGAWLGDPMEVALVEMAQSAAPGLPLNARIGEIPFDADRKRLSTIHDTPEGSILYCKGALETVLPLRTTAASERLERPLDAPVRQEMLDAETAMAGRGLRVLALAFRLLPAQWNESTAERDLVLVGLVGLEDPPRPGVAGAVRNAREAGIRIIVVTGDHPHTSVALAREIGLVAGPTPTVITGADLRGLSENELRLVLDARELVFARSGADQKLRIVRALQEKGEIVAATGDGVNDAPAIKEANIGIAMGRTGTDVAREAADMILLDDDFTSIVNAIEQGRAVFDNIRKFMTYILSSNIPEIVPYLAFVLFGIPLPLTVIQILAVDLGTDMVPALALGADPPDRQAMTRPPRPPAERLLSWPLLARAYLFLGPLEAVAAMSAYFFVMLGGGWAFGAAVPATDPLYRQATTACLAAIVVTQVANLFLCRSAREPAVASGLRSNPLILLGIATELALIAFIVYTPWGNTLFGTAPLDAAVWLFALPFAAAMFAAEESRKWLARRRR
jgi:calcium-translocating P-type ATPase